MTSSQRFADLDVAARVLAAAIPDRVIDEMDLVVALGERAVPIAEVVAGQLAGTGNRGGSCALLAVDRGEGPVLGAPPECTGRQVMVVDYGVETGQAAMLAGRALRAAGAARLILAVAVCSRQVEWTLAGVYDEIFAVQQPLGRRALQWHFDTPLE